MWPFGKKKRNEQRKANGLRPSQATRGHQVSTPCSTTCTCSFPELFRYRELPEFVGTKLTLANMTSIREDVLRQLKMPFRLGKYIEWANDGDLPGYAGELWKFRRAELSFEIDDSVHCDIAGRAVIEQLALHLDGDFPHEGFLKEIEKRGDRLVLKLMQIDPGGRAYRGNGGHCSEGQAMLLVSKSEEMRYRQALKAYAERTNISSKDLTFEDGVRCFLGEYLPEEFTVDDACITNLTSAWFCKHFAM